MGIFQLSLLDNGLKVAENYHLFTAGDLTIIGEKPTESVKNPMPSRIIGSLRLVKTVSDTIDLIH